MITYAQARQVRTVAEVRAALFADVAARGVDVAGFGDLSVPRAELELSARAISAEEAIRAQLALTLSLRGAAAAGDDWLDIVAEGRFDEARIPAQKTQWNIPVTAASAGGTVVIEPYELTAVSSSGGLLFTNLEKQTLAAGASATLVFEALVAGQSGNVLGTSISTFQVGKAGLTISGTPVLLRGGRDKESNDAYIDRCIAKWGSLGAGNLAFYNYWIPKASPTITRWRVRDDNPGGPSTVYVYAANAAGPATTIELDELRAMILPEKPNGVQVLFFAAQEINVPVAVELVLDGSNADALDDIEAQLLALAAVFPLGPKTLFRSLLIGVAQGGDFDEYDLAGVGGVASVAALTPAGDTLLGAGAVLTITPTVTEAP